jgi:hypothetical protein
MKNNIKIIKCPKCNNGIPLNKETSPLLKTAIYSDGWNDGYQKALKDFVEECKNTKFQTKTGFILTEQRLFLENVKRISKELGAKNET